MNGRNILNLAGLVPGVVPQGTTDGNALTGKNVFAAGNYQIGGGIANQSATYYDGVPANAGVGNLTVMVPSPDAISEFRVQTNSNSAEFGRYAGGIVNVTSKSGTNEFHGSAYEFFRNKVLNCQYFLRQRQRHRVSRHLLRTSTDLPAADRSRKTRSSSSPPGKVMTPARDLLSWRPCRSRPCIAATSRAIRIPPARVIPIYDPLTQCGQYNNAALRKRHHSAHAVPRQHHSGQPDRPGCREDRGLPHVFASQPAGPAVHA